MGEINNQKHDDTQTLPRIHIHLNLAKADRAHNTVKVYNPDTGRWPTVAYADALILKNVTPIVHDKIAMKIATGELAHKTPHAFLEADLVSWVGDFRKSGNYISLKQDLFQSRVCEEGQPFDPFCVELSKLFNRAVEVGYNPKTARCFYTKNNEGEALSKFLSAKELGVCGWFFSAKDEKSTALLPSDLVETPPEKSSFERTEIPKGIKTSIARTRLWKIKKN